MAERWCTVTVTDQYRQRFSLDVFALSTCDACHRYLDEAVNGQPRTPPLPKPTVNTRFEVSLGGKVYWVTGTALKQWIAKHSLFLRGNASDAFRKRATL